MDRHQLPHACLLCHPIALPFRTFWEARRHVRDDHPEYGDRFPEEFLRVLPADSVPTPAVDPLDEPPYLCLHCQADGRIELRNTVDDIDRHYRQSHVGSDFNRMGMPPPPAKEGEDYITEALYKHELEAKIKRFQKELESLRTTTDLFTEFELDFFNDPPEDR